MQRVKRCLLTESITVLLITTFRILATARINDKLLSNVFSKIIPTSYDFSLQFVQPSQNVSRVGCSQSVVIGIKTMKS